MTEPSQTPEQFHAPEVLCPTCPVCGSEPMLLFPGLAQTWCPNDDCAVFCWSPWDTAEANLADASEVTEIIENWD